MEIKRTLSLYGCQQSSIGAQAARTWRSSCTATMNSSSRIACTTCTILCKRMRADSHGVARTQTNVRPVASPRAPARRASSAPPPPPPDGDASLLGPREARAATC